MQWYLRVLQNYVGFQGRATRTEYWMFVLVNVIISIILSFLQRLLHIEPILSCLYSLAVLLPSLAVSVRRLHDTGKTGWWVLISIIPLIGDIILLVFLCLASDEGENKYGPNPKLL